ncbi:MAG: hypothetical protein WA040_24790 [Anaerolineae bacterium]
MRPALLLHAPSPADLDALWADRAVRQHLGQRLASDQASVRSAEPGHLGFTVSPEGRNSLANRPARTS